MPKTYTRLQALRKSHAQTKGADARIKRMIERLLPVIARDKKDRPLTDSELKLIDNVRELLNERIRIAAFDAAIRMMSKYPD
jgi:hypothetical protein